MDVRHIEMDNVPLKPPDMSKPVRVTIEGTEREYRLVRAERNWDGTWDLVLELPPVGLSPTQPPK